jgi:hypothetical protein
MRVDIAVFFLGSEVRLLGLHSLDNELNLLVVGRRLAAGQPEIDV